MIVDRLSLRGRKRSVIRNEVFEQTLLWPSLLLKWAPYTIEERCRIVQQKFDYDLQPYRLLSLYGRNGVTFRRSGVTYQLNRWE